ncbi:hypothetical protein TraAM80_01118 [Trypanosoma rangeli]|uniref:Uncharacterized protein n=1 Tax=Trypanosoma rangeli TaxID=5698 RepID=A0A3R7RRA2_TRYRA|nr:uncharacterized protein TraAM80_01118 [Trypanosoma rangeli]RNF11186.1 hypothetical protein TraAM80_01118 [Trypanosoma rangeli]|eukprot:RNF11186.1 hypothetical protein TraAM80_01118 [Trypanosoma rangeli]
MELERTEHKPRSVLSILRNVLGTHDKECGVSCGIQSDPIPGKFRKRASYPSRAGPVCCISTDGMFSLHGNIVTVNDAEEISINVTGASSSLPCGHFNLTRMSIPRFAAPSSGLSLGKRQLGTTDEGGSAAYVVRGRALKMTIKGEKMLHMESWLSEQRMVGAGNS